MRELGPLWGNIDVIMEIGFGTRTTMGGLQLVLDQMPKSNDRELVLLV